VVVALRAPTRGRIGTVALRAGPVVIPRPRHGGDRSDPRHLTLHMVEAREIDASAGGQPLLWRLLTTRAVTSAVDAQDIVRLYRLRWRIEEIFRALKSGLADGMEIASSYIGEASIPLASIAPGRKDA